MARIQIRDGRYQTGLLRNMMAKLARANRESRLPTDTERVIGYLSYSIENDFRDGFRRREHGNDAQSVAMRRASDMEPVAAQERVEQEIEMLRVYQEALDEAARAVESRLSELDTARGSMVLLEGQRAIRDARDRIAKKAAAG